MRKVTAELMRMANTLFWWFDPFLQYVAARSVKWKRQEARDTCYTATYSELVATGVDSNTQAYLNTIVRHLIDVITLLYNPES